VSASLWDGRESRPWFVAAFEAAAALEASRRRVAGVVCGHIHQPALRWMGSILYCNTGDWLESRTAVLEHFDGRLELVGSTSVASDARATSLVSEEAASR